MHGRCIMPVDSGLKIKEVDIKDRNDIEKIIRAFYEKAVKDPTIGTFFTEVVMVNWEKNLPIMYDFWENILFATRKYVGNPLEIHRQLNKKKELTPEHFQQWLELFTATVDELYGGENAELMKQRAENIAIMMEIKIKI